MTDGNPRLLSTTDLTAPEAQAREALATELMHLRAEAMRAESGSHRGNSAATRQSAEAVSADPWYFADRNRIVLVCAQLPSDLRAKMPYTDPDDPDFISLYRYSDLDALVEVHGALRAANPRSGVFIRSADQITSDDYTSHLVSVGGVDWNTATRSVLARLQLPVKQIAEWHVPGGTYFEVEHEGGQSRYPPHLDTSGDSSVLVEDVALFAQAVNPWNRKRKVTICNGMYGRGSYGVVRALTDSNFREDNAAYVSQRFGVSEAYCLLTRVAIENKDTVTPDWTDPETRLFEWSRQQ
jgi:hypothetical protein